jgi:hypothetical protein
MMNPPTFPLSGSNMDLVSRITHRMVQQDVDGQILGFVQRAYERELGKENVLLSRPERVRLYQMVTRAVLTRLLEKMEGKGK